VNADTIKAVHTLAEEASELRRVLIDELHKTFITPLDREDIFNLSHCFEDIVTYALTTVEEMNILKVDADDYIREMMKLECEEAEQLELAILRLARTRTSPWIMRVPCANWNAGSNACIAPRSRICSPAPPILNACRNCSIDAKSTGTFPTCPTAPTRRRTCSAWSL